MLTSEERSMIARVLDLQNRTVRSITVPLQKVVGVEPKRRAGNAPALPAAWADAPAGLAIRRRPAHRRNCELAQLSLRIDFDPAKASGIYVTPALFLRRPPIGGGLRRMRRSGQRLAIVLGPDQRELGIVSLQDILKVIFGDIRL